VVRANVRSPTEPQIRGCQQFSPPACIDFRADGLRQNAGGVSGSLDALFRQGAEHDLPDETQVVYVSPLKALSNDIRKNLQERFAD